MASDAPWGFALANSSAADGDFLRAAFAAGEASCTARETDDVGGEGAWFVATWTCFRLGGGSGWFSCSAIHTSKPAAIAPARASHCQRAPLKRRARRDFLDCAAMSARWLWLAAVASGNDSRFRAAMTGSGSLTP